MERRLPFSDVAGLMRVAAFRFFEKPAFSLVSQSGAAGSLSYGDFDALSAAVGRFLAWELGLGRGEPVLVLQEEGYAVPVVAMGIMRSGLCMVPISCNLTPASIVKLAQASEATVCFIDENRADLAAHIFEHSSVRTIVTCSPTDFVPFRDAVAAHTTRALRSLLGRFGRFGVTLQQVVQRMSGERHPSQSAPDSESFARTPAVAIASYQDKFRAVCHSDIIERIFSKSPHEYGSEYSKAPAVVSRAPFFATDAFIEIFMEPLVHGLHNIIVTPGVPELASSQAIARIAPRAREFDGTNLHETQLSYNDTQKNAAIVLH